MSTSLTPEERDLYRYQVSASTEHCLFGTVRLIDCLKHQLRKVVGEIESLEPFDHDTWNFGVAVRKWMDAVKKEIG